MKKNSEKFDLSSIIAKGSMMKESAGRPKSKKILNPKKINFGGYLMLAISDCLIALF
jgi:hypothetical protein